MRFLLSIKTVFPRPGARVWYDDQLEVHRQIEWEHVDFQRQTIFITRTKNGEDRTVPMHLRVLEALHTVAREAGFPSEGHVFLNRFGKPYADTRDYKFPGGNPIAKAHRTAC